jgi:GNAT superfamily N-acetyltransferase
MTERELDEIKERAKSFQFSSIELANHDNIARFEALAEGETLILLRDASGRNGTLEYYFAANTADDLLKGIDRAGKNAYLSLVPESFVAEFEKNGFFEYVRWVEYFCPDISGAECGEPLLFAGLSDSAEVSRVTKECAGQSRGFTGETPEWAASWIAGEFAEGSDKTDFAVITARDSGKIAEAVFICVYAHGSRKGPILWVRELAVRPEFQRRGHGGRLLAQALYHGKEHGAVRAFLMADECNEHAIHLYEKLGFVAKKEDGQIDMLLNK